MFTTTLQAIKEYGLAHPTPVPWRAFLWGKYNYLVRHYDGFAAHWREEVGPHIPLDAKYKGGVSIAYVLSTCGLEAAIWMLRMFPRSPELDKAQSILLGTVKACAEKVGGSQMPCVGWGDEYLTEYGHSDLCLFVLQDIVDVWRGQVGGDATKFARGREWDEISTTFAALFCREEALIVLP